MLALTGHIIHQGSLLIRGALISNSSSLSMSGGLEGGQEKTHKLTGPLLALNPHLSSLEQES